jgi:hypothetical protein
VARNFSTARPIFQNMVENVPIAGRAFWEVDWDEKMRQETAKMKLQQKAQTKKASKAEQVTLKMRKENIAALSRVSETQSEKTQEEVDFEAYFPAAALAPVTTYLSIPLAPTPTARRPLDPSPLTSSASAPLLLPLAALGATHALHDNHATRVSSLFARLDAANVWARGAACTAHGDRTGLCTVLLVAFEGWDESMVRAVIGEGGKGWCELHEVRRNDARTSPTFDVESEISFDEQIYADPAQSLVLPSTDLSATEFPFGFPRSVSVSVIDTPFSSTPASAFSSPPASPRLVAGGMDIDDNFSLSDHLSDYSHSPSELGVDHSMPSHFELRMPAELLSEAEDEMSEWGSDGGSDSLVDVSAVPSRTGHSPSVGFSSDFESQWGDVWHA